MGIELEAVYSNKKHFKSIVKVKETEEQKEFDLYALDFLTTPQNLSLWNSERFLSRFQTTFSYIAMGINPIFQLSEKLKLRYPFCL